MKIHCFDKLDFSDLISIGDSIQDFSYATSPTSMNRLIYCLHSDLMT